MNVRDYKKCHSTRRLRLTEAAAGHVATIFMMIVMVCLPCAVAPAQARAQPASPPRTAPEGAQPGAEPARVRPVERARARAARKPAPAPVSTPVRRRRQAADSEDPTAGRAGRPATAPRAAAARASASASGAAASGAAPSGSKKSPVVRAVAGNWGMFFLFGGLADLHHTNTHRSVDALWLTQVGFRYVVSERVVIPLYFSLGVSLTKPPDESTADDVKSWGFELGSGIEYHFRIWRRISPFIAFTAGVGLSEPHLEANTSFDFIFGPALGVEYYIADRVSLTVQYMMALRIEMQQNPSVTGGTEKWHTVQLSTIAGGAVNITYYF